MPQLVVVAGPNGSGKSTLSTEFRSAGLIVIDPDEIARRIDPVNPSQAAIAAGRQTILRCQQLLNAGDSFVLETTLSGHGAISLMQEAKVAGYFVRLIYIALESSAMQIDRVKSRVRRGGHSVPDADVRRRYARSLLRAPDAIRLADEASVIDNSTARSRLALRIRSGAIVWRSDDLPGWARQLAINLES